MFAEFKGFLLKTNALALAVGVIIAVALGAVVTSLVNDIIMPPIGYLLGGVNFADLKIVLGTTTAADGTVTEVAIRWGAFVNTLINFTIIAFIVWRITKLFLKEAPAGGGQDLPLLQGSERGRRLQVQGLHQRDLRAPAPDDARSARRRRQADPMLGVRARVAPRTRVVVVTPRTSSEGGGHRRIGHVAVEVDPEDVLPGSLAAGPRLELAHVQPVPRR